MLPPIGPVNPDDAALAGGVVIGGGLVVGACIVLEPCGLIVGGGAALVGHGLMTANFSRGSILYVYGNTRRR